MAFSETQINKLFNAILVEISKGKALRSILKQKEMPSNETFYKWINEDEEKSKRYARACEERADAIFDEIIEIADDSSQDEVDTEFGVKQNTEFIQRSKVRIDARKWVVSKLNPKKYGDKLDLTTDGEKIIPPSITYTVIEPNNE
jgi:hypothetical protein